MREEERTEHPGCRNGFLPSPRAEGRLQGWESKRPVYQKEVSKREPNELETGETAGVRELRDLGDHWVVSQR
jgi:hypothetical protein